MRSSPTAYLEVFNTTDGPIDLSGYQIMYRCCLDGHETPMYTMPIAPCEGDAILPPRELCVLWLAYASSHNAKLPCLSAEDFCARLEADFSWRNYRLNPADIRIIRVEGAEQAVENGVTIWRDKPDAAEFPKLRVWDEAHICIAPLGGDFENAVCRLTVNNLYPDEWDWNTPIRRASLWKPDPFGGSDMRCTVRSADLTPGTLAKGQILPHLRRDIPVCIIPLGWPEAHPLADGSLTIRFLQRAQETALWFWQTDGIFPPKIKTVYGQ